MIFWSRAAPLAVWLFLAPAAYAQHSAPCPYLIETISDRALKISEAQGRVLDMVAKDSAALEHPRAKACQAARTVISQADDLRKFAEARRSRCSTEEEQGALDAAISLGSAGAARSLAKTFCGG